MAFVLIIVGLLMIISGGRGTYAQFGSQVASEFQGQNNFTYQMIALGAIGMLGYIPQLQTISRWALAFILIVLVLNSKQGSFISQFQNALSQGPTAPNPVGSTGANPTGQGYIASQPLLNLGPLGTINPQLTPGSWAASIYQFFGGKTQ